MVCPFHLFDHDDASSFLFHTTKVMPAGLYNSQNTLVRWLGYYVPSVLIRIRSDAMIQIIHAMLGTGQIEEYQCCIQIHRLGEMLKSRNN